MRKCFLPLSVTLLVPSFGWAADEGDLSLDELLSLEVGVSSATTTEQSLGAAPGTVRVITRQGLDMPGCQTLGEALVSVQGLHVIDDHAPAPIGVRGFDGGAGAWSRIVKVRVNGRPMALPSEGGALTGPEFRPIDVMERIEVINGPGSALYGANAFLGRRTSAAQPSTPRCRGATCLRPWGSSPRSRSRSSSRARPTWDRAVRSRPACCTSSLDGDAPSVETGARYGTHLHRAATRALAEHHINDAETTRLLATHAPFTEEGTRPADLVGTAGKTRSRERSGTTIEAGTDATLRWKGQAFLAGPDANVSTARWSPFDLGEPRAQVHVTNLTGTRFAEGSIGDVWILGAPRRFTFTVS